MNGETATSEDFMLAALLVTAPTEYQVIGTGVTAGEAPGFDPGTTTHRFTAAAVRDVSVAVGRYAVLNREVGGVRVHLATPQAGTKVDPQDWADEIGAAITSLTALFGPFPYPELWVAITPGQSDGTEFPTALQFGDVRRSQLRALVAHEVSHQWVYSLVGNNQAENPWLDESLATFAEGIAGGDAFDYRNRDISRRVVGLMGQPMIYWAGNGGFDPLYRGCLRPGCCPASAGPTPGRPPTASTPLCAPTSRRTRTGSPLRLTPPTRSPRHPKCSTCSLRRVPCPTIDKKFGVGRRKMLEADYSQKTVSALPDLLGSQIGLTQSI
ncbi:MAG: hypothetical protein M3228_04075 [Actinomycetota bacterium]|nr:hypothetical protein [Actinomycetota bacterium]